jgi:hypothetical protein
VDRVRAGWLVLAAVAGAIALAATARWIWAVTLAGPVLYSEGAVAHAALLARSGLEYVPGAAAFDTQVRPIFTAANYPPLFFRVAGLGDPFVIGRIASIASTLFVAGVIAWRAWPAGPLTALAVGAAWLASFPVVVWGAVVKPDLLALALTVAGVVALAVDRRRPLLAGALLALAVWAKPTAVVPALALAVWCARADRGTLVRYIASLSLGLVALGVALVGPTFAEPLAKGACCGWARHVIAWNALAWSPSQVALLGFLALVTIGALVAVPTALRSWRGALGAYGAGALGIVVLGGREGATVNYLLDLTAAGALAVAAAAPALRGPVAPLLIAAQLVIGVAAFDPFGVLAGRPGTGAWGDPGRIDVVRSLPPGPVLAEDSGLLIAAGREPVADDVFLWSRIYALASDGGPPFEEGPRLLEAVGAQRFVAIVTESDLSGIGQAREFTRARWHAHLVEAVLGRYTLDRTVNGLWVYRPK